MSRFVKLEEFRKLRAAAIDELVGRRGEIMDELEEIDSELKSLGWKKPKAVLPPNARPPGKPAGKVSILAALVEHMPVGEAMRVRDIAELAHAHGATHSHEGTRQALIRMMQDGLTERVGPRFDRRYRRVK